MFKDSCPYFDAYTDTVLPTSAGVKKSATRVKICHNWSTGAPIEAMEDTPLEGKSISEISADDDLFQQFLIHHRFFLSPRLYPLGTFYAYMISKNVFRSEEQDEAESHPVRLNRVGTFLDIVATKGPKGFQAFLEVLEYDYPHVYWHVANVKPRDRPIGWRPTSPMSAGSVRLKQKMADLISDLTQHSEEKKEKNEKLEQYVMEIEEDHRKEREKLKKDLEGIINQKADLQEVNTRYKAELDELRRTSCTNRDTIERMRQEIRVLEARRLTDMAENSQERSHSLDMSAILTGNDSTFLQTQLSTLKETEKQLLEELKERKEDYNKLVVEYSKKEQECETLRKKVDSCREESNYYTNKSSDLAHEFNALLGAFQQVTRDFDEEPIYRTYYRARQVPDDGDLYVDLYVDPDKLRCKSGVPPVPGMEKVVSGDRRTGPPPPILPPRTGRSEKGGKCVVVIHAPTEIQEALHKKLLDLPSQNGSGSTNPRMFTTVEMESSSSSEAELQGEAISGKVLHYEPRSRGGFVVLSTDRLKQAVKNSSQHVLLQMPPYKEFAIRIKAAGIKFIVILVKVEQQREPQLVASIKAKMSGRSIATVTVPNTQLAGVDALSKTVLNKVQDLISRLAT
ncbi:hypothetical protein LSAT2_011759 [Lamellibrachia satsuma]|nr:hypothetical protein LSAT2_011759 [Lamellibrachia satsuma]